MVCFGASWCVALLSLGLVKAQYNQTCYFVDGEQALPTQQQCFSGSQVSGCCKLGGPNPDVCLDTGLCLSYGGTVYQGGCTDKEGTANGCPHFCPDPYSGWSTANHTQYWNVLICAPNQYCCRKAGDDTTDCCHDHSLIQTRTPPVGMPTTKISVSGATNSTSTNSTSPSVAPGTPGSTETCKTGSGKIAAVGAGVGASLGALLAAALAAIFVLYRRTKALRRELEYTKNGGDASAAYPQVQEYDGATQVYQPSVATSPAPASSYTVTPHKVSEIDSHGNGIAEMDGTR